MDNILNIDGSMLEGGGQNLRISVSLSAILGIPVKVTNIRQKRSKPGLAAQHLTGIRLVAEMCQAKLSGAYIGSTEIEFIPGKVRGGHYIADTKTAGSISLVLQVALPCALVADSPVTLDLKGGTNADMAPQIDYMDKVFHKLLKQFGVDFSMQIIRRGYFPRGGGHVRVEVAPATSLRGVQMTSPGAPQHIAGWSFVAGTLSTEMALKMCTGATEALDGFPVHIQCRKEPCDVARDNCAGIILQCTMSTGQVLGSDGLCRRGQRPYDVGNKCGNLMRRLITSGACVDSYAQDQLIIYMCMAEGESSVRVHAPTLHTETAMRIVDIIAKTKFTCREDGDHSIIQCVGLGVVGGAR